MPPTDNNAGPVFLGRAFQRLLELAEQKMQRAETGVEFIKRCCKTLSAYGVQQIICEYDGSGDSGDFFSTVAVVVPPREEVDNKLNMSSSVTQDAIEQLTRPKNVRWDDFVAARRKDKDSLISATDCDTLIDNAFDLLPGGWEINDGSYGTITIDIATENISIEHNERYTDVRTENFSF